MVFGFDGRSAPVQIFGRQAAAGGRGLRWSARQLLEPRHVSRRAASRRREVARCFRLPGRGLPVPPSSWHDGVDDHMKSHIMH